MSVSPSIKSKISQMMNDGLSNREILKEINKILKTQGKDTLHYAALSKIINSLMDDLVPTFESDEEDEEYVPPTQEESDDSDDEDEEYVPSEAEEDDESEDEDEEDESEEDEDDAEEDSDGDYDDEDRCNIPIYIYFNHPMTRCDKHDRLVITPNNGICSISYEFERSKGMDAVYVNSFTANHEATLDYIRDIFSLLSIDQKPFTEIEIMIPFYPGFSITPNKLHDKTVETILRVMNVYLNYTIQ